MGKYFGEFLWGNTISFMKDREKKLNTGIYDLLDKHSMFVFNDNLYYTKALL